MTFKLKILVWVKQHGSGNHMMEFTPDTMLDEAKAKINEKFENIPGNHWFIHAGKQVEGRKTL